MINDGDRIMVCISGGKDSFAMLEVLMALQKKAPVRFTLTAVCIDQNFPKFPARAISDFMATKEIEFKLVKENIKGIIETVIPKEASSCSLCARLRRGVLYTTAKKLGMNKVALGHHRDDVIETLFLNLFHNGRIKAIPPKLLTSSKELIVIRPLFSVREQDIQEYANAMDYPLAPQDLCGRRQNEKRREVKRMLRTWEDEDPGRLDVIFSSLTRLDIPFLADKDRFDFPNLEGHVLKGSDAEMTSKENKKSTQKNQD